jgi:hypothetical protein
VAKPVTDHELEQLLAKLRPALEKAVQGDFSAKISMTNDDPYNDIYAGVQLLLDTIEELEETNGRLYEYLSRRHGLTK